MTVGRVMATDAEVTVPLEALRKHVVIFVDGRLIEEVRMLRREQRLTNIWYAVATGLLAVVIAFAGWTVWRA